MPPPQPSRIIASMPRGRRPLPTALRKLEGNRGKRPFNEREPQPSPGEPAMPPLSREAAKEWKRIVPILMALGILTVADGSALAIYCTAFARWQQAERQLSRSRNLASDKARKLFAISEKCMKLMKSVLVGIRPDAGVTAAPGKFLHLADDARRFRRSRERVLRRSADTLSSGEEYFRDAVINGDSASICPKYPVRARDLLCPCRWKSHNL